MAETWKEMAARQKREREEAESIRLRHREEISGKLESLRIGDPELPCQRCLNNLHQEEYIWRIRRRNIRDLRNPHEPGVITLSFEGKEFRFECPLANSRDCPSNSRLMKLLLEHSGIGKHYWQVDESKIQLLDAINVYLNALPDNITAGQGLIISGPPGVGKTSILSYVYQCCEWSRLLTDNRYYVRYEFVPNLFNALTRADTDADCYERPDLLLLDDFGREYQNDFAMSRFEALIEHRYANGKPVIVTTNLSSKRLAENDRWERIIDRWRECCQLLQISGESMRKPAVQDDDRAPGGND